MPLKILHDKDKGLSCLYDEIEMKPIGILFYEDESISDFLVWYNEYLVLNHAKQKMNIEALYSREIENKIREWRSMYLNTQTK